MITGQLLLFALLGGILPALLWLWFWLKEDKARPEPRGIILLAFIAGIITVPFAILFESLSVKVFPGILTIAIAAGPIEELLKYIAAAILVLKRKANDEPIDAIIYMITVALGFAARCLVQFAFQLVLDQTRQLLQRLKAKALGEVETIAADAAESVLDTIGALSVDRSEIEGAVKAAKE